MTIQPQNNLNRVECSRVVSLTDAKIELRNIFHL